MSQQIGLQPDTLRDLVFLAMNHACRTVEEQEAIERAALKLDRQEGSRDGEGSVYWHAIDSLKRCGEHADDDEYASGPILDVGAPSERVGSG